MQHSNTALGFTAVVGSLSLGHAAQELLRVLVVNDTNLGPFADMHGKFVGTRKVFSHAKHGTARQEGSVGRTMSRPPSCTEWYTADP